jgi:hypothetical protein
MFQVLAQIASLEELGKFNKPKRKSDGKIPSITKRYILTDVYYKVASEGSERARRIPRCDCLIGRFQGQGPATRVARAECRIWQRYRLIPIWPCFSYSLGSACPWLVEQEHKSHHSLLSVGPTRKLPNHDYYCSPSR